MSANDTDEDVDINELRRVAGIQNEMPPGFVDWPRHQQADYVARQMTRVGLIERILARMDYEPERDVASTKRLTKEELAIIYIALGGVTEQ